MPKKTTKKKLNPDAMYDITPPFGKMPKKQTSMRKDVWVTGGKEYLSTSPRLRGKKRTAAKKK